MGGGSSYPVGAGREVLRVNSEFSQRSARLHTEAIVGPLDTHTSGTQDALLTAGGPPDAETARRSVGTTATSKTERPHRVQTQTWPSISGRRATRSTAGSFSVEGPCCSSTRQVQKDQVEHGSMEGVGQLGPGGHFQAFELHNPVQQT